MPKCTFCGKQFQTGEGTLYVKKDGTASFFCTGKCQKNSLKLKRSPFSVKWTDTYQNEKKKGKKKGTATTRRKKKKKKKKR